MVGDDSERPDKVGLVPFGHEGQNNEVTIAEVFPGSSQVTTGVVFLQSLSKRGWTIHIKTAVDPPPPEKDYLLV